MESLVLFVLEIARKKTNIKQTFTKLPGSVDFPPSAEGQRPQGRPRKQRGIESWMPSSSDARRQKDFTAISNLTVDLDEL